MNIKIYDSNDFPSYLPKLSHLYDDLFSGGKGFRAKLIQMIGSIIALDEKKMRLLSQTIEFIHNASLLHDDLIDHSALRRGKTTAWKKFTPEYAVLAGDYLLARVMVNLSSDGNIKMVNYTAQMISDLLEGEWLQDSLVGDLELDLESLDRVHNLKTASLFKWCLTAPFMSLIEKKTAVNNPEKLFLLLEECGTLLGLLFQRSDDLLDFDIRNHEGKAALGDLKSGYLNSFAAFACQKNQIKDRAELQKMDTLKQFKTFLSKNSRTAAGTDVFTQSVKEFDQVNQQLIDKYNHYLDEIKKELVSTAFVSESAATQLEDKLKPLPDLLYWRRKP